MCAPCRSFILHHHRRRRGCDDGHKSDCCFSFSRAHLRRRLDRRRALETTTTTTATKTLLPEVSTIMLLGGKSPRRSQYGYGTDQYYHPKCACFQNGAFHCFVLSLKPPTRTTEVLAANSVGPSQPQPRRPKTHALSCVLSCPAVLSCHCGMC